MSPTPDYWEEAKAYLSKRDKKLGKIIGAYQGEALELKGKPFETLARSIVGQQISVKAADSVHRRFVEAVGKVTPDKVANAPAERLRASGLSASKVIYMHALAMHFQENKRTIKNWPNMTDAEIIKELTSIKGIGVWTAEMFLLFALGRPDVFPLLDLGLLKGIYRTYNKGEKMDKAAVVAVGERWRPYRSVGTWYMWRALDPVPVAY
ncbi:MAG: DNA-3-methyladenine glycosylase 2 family protein [Proteobacteria bacterium]|nr:DNA-3-methyladenine glycosylase 2 family protein [Pseudomonadota bacterium]